MRYENNTFGSTAMAKKPISTSGWVKVVTVTKTTPLQTKIGGTFVPLLSCCVTVTFPRGQLVTAAAQTNEVIHGKD
jgi:hypothetical protein